MKKLIESELMEAWIGTENRDVNLLKAPVRPLWALSDLSKLPVLSIRQPWAWAILNAGKDIENRSWRTKLRGRFLIHSAKGGSRRDYVEAEKTIRRTASSFPHEYSVPDWAKMDRGGIVGIAEIVDCVTSSPSSWFTGKWGFVLRNAQPLEFLPCPGALGFFTLPTSSVGELKTTNTVLTLKRTTLARIRILAKAQGITVEAWISEALARYVGRGTADAFDGRACA